MRWSQALSRPPPLAAGLRAGYLLGVRDVLGLGRLAAGRRTPCPGTIKAISAVLGVAPEQVLEFRSAMGYHTSEESIDEH